jgi:hypothetical protein
VTPEVDAAIAERFPSEWARANDGSLRGRSKARNNLRKRYRYVVELEAFKAANPDARCGNCAHGDLNPSVGIKGLSCELDSDFHGYAMVDPANVCARWDASPAFQSKGRGE